MGITFIKSLAIIPGKCTIGVDCEGSHGDMRVGFNDSPCQWIKRNGWPIQAAVGVAERAVPLKCRTDIDIIQETIQIETLFLSNTIPETGSRNYLPMLAPCPVYRFLH